MFVEKGNQGFAVHDKKTGNNTEAIPEASILSDDGTDYVVERGRFFQGTSAPVKKRAESKDGTGFDAGW